MTRLVVLALCFAHACATAINITEILNAHNTLRRQYNAHSLKWDNMLATNASTWAGKCAFKHSDYPWGENMALGWTSNTTILIDMWAQEAKTYNYSNPDYSHFSQMVWVATKYIGCALVGPENCPNGTGKPAYKGAYMLLCEYNPPGNYGSYAENVLHPTRQIPRPQNRRLPSSHRSLQNRPHRRSRCRRSL